MSDGDQYTYKYTGDGQLYEMTDKNGGSPIRYLYSYDTLGRLIGTGQTGGTSELRAAYQYDTNNRLTRMSYSIPRKSIFQDITQVIVIKQTIEHDF